MTSSSPRLRAVGLFAGIGGIELGLNGYEPTLLCEIDPGARAVLEDRFPGVPIHDDVATLEELPEADLVAAGFPCQDLSQAGRTAGIEGAHSSLIAHVFDLLARSPCPPRWLLIENVPFMLQLNQGHAMRYLTSALEAHGLRWAYRVVDTRAFGLPQRRQRVLLLASPTHDPRPILFNGNEPALDDSVRDAEAYGFYWTEGLRGLGWAPNAIPTLKGGSGLGIPSPPGIWVRETGELIVPDIEDAECLQGFSRGWTAAAEGVGGKGGRGARWRLVGNAVSVPVAKWIAGRLRSDAKLDSGLHTHSVDGTSWPRAAWGDNGRVYGVQLTPFPAREACPPVLDVVKSRTPLSARATAGFFSRLSRSNLSAPDEFRADAAAHLARMEAEVLAA